MTFRSLIRKLALVASLLVFSLAARAEHRVVIFWAPLGNGHKAAAESMKKAIEAKDPTAKVVLQDVLDFMYPGVKATTQFLFEKTTQLSPETYDAIFKAAMIEARLKSKMSEMSTSSMYNLKAVAEYLRKNKPTVLLSSFSIANEVLYRLKERHVIPEGIKIGWQHTDYATEDYFVKIAKEADMAFLPDESLRQTWIREYQAKPEKLITTGMPVDPKYLKIYTDLEKTKVYETYGLDKNRKTFLIMSGANGLGDYTAMVKSLSNTFYDREPIQIVAICGKNTDQLKKMNALVSQLPEKTKLIPMGFVPNDTVADMMHVANLKIGKAGGLSSSQDFVVGIPTIFLDNNGGQEVYNIKFFEKLGFALGTKNEGNVGKLAQTLLSKGPEDPKLSEARERFIKNLRTDRIADWALEQSEKVNQLYPTGPDYKEIRAHWLSQCGSVISEHVQGLFKN